MVARRDGAPAPIRFVARGGDYASDDDCQGAVVAALTRVNGDAWPELLPGALVVDFATEGAARVAVVPSAHRREPDRPQTVIAEWGTTFSGGNCGPVTDEISWPGAHELTSVAWDRGGLPVVQSRQPAALLRLRASDVQVIALSDVDRRDTGHSLFHHVTGSGLACASCHPAGRDDGHVWQFVGLGDRRTQSLAGTLANTAPYHWDGALEDFPALVTEVLVERMFGPELDDAEMAAFNSWVLSLPPPALATADPLLVEQGRALFEDPEVGCSACHAGAMFTDNSSEDVGTGASFQVPSLIGVGRRAPYMHDGCAATLADRFTPQCGGDAHGHTERLAPDQRMALIAYLEAL